VLAENTVWTYSILVDKSLLAVQQDLLLQTRPPPVAAAARHDAAAPALESLHPALWRAHQLGRGGTSTWSSGFAALDAELPGGGWPLHTLTELLLPGAGIGEMRLLAPVLRASARGAMLFDPPAVPSGWALAALGLDLRQWVLVQGRDAARGRAPGPAHERLREKLPAADILWALEQALASGQAGVVLAWLPATLRSDALRRLQLAAQGHDAPAFLLRPAQARLRPSVAPLRLWLGAAGPDALRVQLVKRRGPPAADPLTLALPPVLADAVRAKALRSLRPVSVASNNEPPARTADADADAAAPHAAAATAWPPA